MTIAEIRKYESEDDMIPKSQEDQLEYLMDKFSLADLKSAYHVTTCGRTPSCPILSL